jgi:hypothetical protein
MSEQVKVKLRGGPGDGVILFAVPDKSLEYAYMVNQANRVRPAEEVAEEILESMENFSVDGFLSRGQTTIEIKTVDYRPTTQREEDCQVFEVVENSLHSS